MLKSFCLPILLACYVWCRSSAVLVTNINDFFSIISISISVMTKVRERKYRRLEHSIMVQADIRSRWVIIGQNYSLREQPVDILIKKLM